MNTTEAIRQGKTALGIEFGSTRVKAVLTGPDHQPIAVGAHDWHDNLVDGVWTYSMDQIHQALTSCYQSLKADVRSRYGETLTTVGAIGVSAMMHGYLAFDKAGKLLVPFRTWRNTNTGAAAKALSELFSFNMPLRWSLSHLYQCVLDGEEHLSRLDFLTTLAGFVHWRLTGCKVLGVGDASGMMPIDPVTGDFDEERVAAFDKLVAPKAYPWHLRDILPEVLPAGTPAGVLTEEGALLLDPSGHLRAGIPLCPPEGDAGTGMVATNAVRPRTGNVSAGTSDFAMVVVDKKLKVHREIDMVTTPVGKPVAMVHCNNCTSDINAWVNLFRESIDLFGFTVDTNTLYTKLFKVALEGDNDCGDLLSYNYYSGEGVTDLDQGRPLFIRKADSAFSLANFMRTHLYSALATLKIGMDILSEENVEIDKIYGHGGFFKTEGVGQRILSAAINAPVSVMKTAGEGGPFGMALLGAYALWKDEGETLEDYLDHKVFASCESSTIMADQPEVDGFNKFISVYKYCLDVEKLAIERL